MISTLYLLAFSFITNRHLYLTQKRLLLYCIYFSLPFFYIIAAYNPDYLFIKKSYSIFFQKLYYNYIILIHNFFLFILSIILIGQLAIFQIKVLG